MKNQKKRLFMITAMAIAMISLPACNTTEDDIVKVTPNPATTATTDTSATIAPSEHPSVTPDAQSTASATPEPSATGNATAKPTSTQKPTATASKTATATKTAVKTSTPKPTATPTKAPTKKPTATKTATPKPTATAQKEVYQTIEYEGKTYKVLMGRNGNPNLIKDYSTLPKILQAYAYPTFDKEAIMMDIYKYAKTQGFKYFYNPNVPLLKESSIGDTNYPESFVPGGNMTAELAEEAFSWYSPSVVAYLGDSVYTDEYYATEVDSIIAQREGNFSMVDFLAMRDNDCLILWIRDYGDSSYRKTYWDDGLYNGKVTKEYALYFMYGGCNDLVQEVKI